MDLSNLTDEQIERAKTCTTGQELLAFAQEEGVELTDEQMEMVTGGIDWLDSIDPSTLWKNIPVGPH